RLDGRAMRTMLISLVCLFSLSQLAIASNLIDIPEKQCGDKLTFLCYVPEICTDENLVVSPGVPLSDVKVVEVVKDAKITKD
ncbi:hypothetical protein PMAYCL1PPCAC_14007, partial [Pristionchus mayeri]